MLDLANARVEGVGLQRAMAGTLGFAKPSTWVLNLANARVDGVGLRRTMAGLANARVVRVQVAEPAKTRMVRLGFAKSSTRMLDFANPGWVGLQKREGGEGMGGQACKNMVKLNLRMEGGLTCISEGGMAHFRKN